MRCSIRLTILAMVLAMLLLSGCGGSRQEQESPAGTAAAPPPAPVKVAIAELTALGESGVRGRVVFTEQAGKLRVEADVTGLSPGEHGFHVHEFGDCSAPDGTSAGPHFNPQDMPHAGPDSPEAHAGDLGNITADANGRGVLTLSTDRITLDSGPNSVLGRGVIVHASQDDLMTQPTGAAGARLACGVIKLQGGETTPVLPPT
ncbi:MAG: superoxide dismutase family protein [Acidobacteriota bacterium]|nr:MAG: superoxide dismutase family protein [Acidobacteriota bacterium]